jgi:hypothetical protein
MEHHMEQTPAVEAARAAHPETFRTGVVKPGTDGVPELIAPRSSNIHGIGYADGVLFLQFPAGKVYRYTTNGDSMGAHHDEMLMAESVGSYFAREIRNNPRVICTYLGRVMDPQPVASTAAMPLQDMDGKPMAQHENGDGV